MPWTTERIAGHECDVYDPPARNPHGYVVLSDHAVFSYLCTAHYDRAADAAVRWDDPALAIDWPVTAPVLSPKDRSAPLLADIAPERLPIFAP